MTQHCETAFGRRCSLTALVFATLVFLAAANAAVVDDLAVETVATGLRAPLGVAIRPSSNGEIYEIFIADAGVGRIVRVRNTKPGSGEDAIAGFVSKSDTGPDIDDPFLLTGPHGLLFLDSARLVVTGSEGDGRPFVRLYELPNQDKPLTAEQHEQHIGQPGEAQPNSGVNVFHGLARTIANDRVPDLLIISVNGTDGAAGTWKVPVRSGTLGEVAAFGSAEPTGDDALPPAVAVEPRGHVIIVQAREAGDAQSSRMQFVNPIDGRVTLEIAIPLGNVVGLSYSPRTGNLYAIAGEQRGAEPNGVYRIDAGKPGEESVAATRIANVPRPTAAAFGPDGILYVTSMGKSNGDNKNDAVLLKIIGDL
ncbi:MAG: hypothetical protein L0228_04370 [Planctomycetes bacterium]|nr:hypothetical protein [Planctomycetota bacterium]